jgi:hypothetical protein
MKKSTLMAVLGACVLIWLVKVAGNPGRPYFRLLASNERISIMQIRPSHAVDGELSIGRRSLIYYHEIMSGIAMRIANLRGEPEIDLMNLEAFK